MTTTKQQFEDLKPYAIAFGLKLKTAKGLKKARKIESIIDKSVKKVLYNLDIMFYISPKSQILTKSTDYETFKSLRNSINNSNVRLHGIVHEGRNRTTKGKDQRNLENRKESRRIIHRLYKRRANTLSR